MKKPTLYFDTSIISAYWYEGADVAMLARRLHTREWWDLERKRFSLWASAFSEAELDAGHFPRQRECLKMIRRLRYLTVTNSVKDLIDELLERGLVIDYLLTWNYAHLANANVQARFNSLGDELELVAPLMVSPESIPQDRFGQSIRRRI